MTSDVRQQAGLVFRDTIGVILGASVTATMSELYERTARRQASSEATIIGRLRGTLQRTPRSSTRPRGTTSSSMIRTGHR
jgi:hypothetical protein